jgi:hypothetical protein
MEPIEAGPAPQWQHAKRYHDTETGAEWQVVTEYWVEGAPEAEDGDPCPFAPGLVAVQRTIVLSSEDVVTRTFLPVCPL